jgi:hypothetical protein
MSRNRKARTLKTDLMLAAVMVAAGLAVSAISLARLANSDLKVAQATPAAPAEKMPAPVGEASSPR